MRRRLAWLSLLAWTLGCGASRPRPIQGDGEGRPPDLRAEPIHVRATGDPEQPVIEAYDAAGLFRRAGVLLREGRCRDAISLYERLVAEFPDSRFAPPALYNRGLCHEQGADFQSAAADFSRIVTTYPDSRDVTDALFRLGGACERLAAWEDAQNAFARILSERTDLEAAEQVEALARQGAALIHLGRPEQARAALEQAGMLFRTDRGIGPMASTYYYAMAQFKLGELVQGEMEAVRLPADEAQIEPALERKCQLLLDAQKEYAKAIRIAHPHWAAAAAYRIGNLYRRLWDDLIAAPVPADLGPEEQAIYLQILRERIQVLLKKAVVQWERTLKMARRLSIQSEWIDETEAELAEVRTRMTEAPPARDPGSGSGGGAP